MSSATVPWRDRRPSWVRLAQRCAIWPGRVGWFLLGGYRFGFPVPTLWGSTPSEIGEALRTGRLDKNLWLTVRGHAPWVQLASNRVYVRSGVARTATPDAFPAVPADDVTVTAYTALDRRRGSLVVSAGGTTATVEGSNRALSIFRSFLESTPDATSSGH